MSIKEGDPILLYLTERKRWLVKVIKDSTMHTHKGFIELKNALDKEYGEGIKSSLGTTFWLLKPTMEDYVMKSARKTQIVYPKDMGIIAEFAKSMHCPTPLFSATADIYTTGMAQGRSEEDTGAVCAVLSKMACLDRD